MEHVCFDLDGTSPWHYDAETKMYYRSFADGKHEGQIAGEYLPNPHQLHEGRMLEVTKIQGKCTDLDAERNRPSATTYALFEHWQKVNK